MCQVFSHVLFTYNKNPVEYYFPHLIHVRTKDWEHPQGCTLRKKIDRIIEKLTSMATWP